jgi:hypothetical protein
MTRRVGAFVSALILSGWACGPAVTVTHLEARQRDAKALKKPG